MLKNILSLLLSKFYSKQENDTISHLATPTINNPVNVTLATDANSVIVAPFDGYLNIETTAEGNPTINVWEALWCNSTPISPAQAKLFVPVTKGQRIQYRITGTISQARFIRLVGGGYQVLKKFILQGGGLCLRSYSSSLWTRPAPSLMEARLTLFRLRLLPQQWTECNTSRLQMVLLLCPRIQATLLSRWLQEITSRLLGTWPERVRGTVSEFVFRSEKGKRTFSNLFLTKWNRKDTPSLFLRNLAVGGASC